MVDALAFGRPSSMLRKSCLQWRMLRGCTHCFGGIEKLVVVIPWHRRKIAKFKRPISFVCIEMIALAPNTQIRVHICSTARCWLAEEPLENHSYHA